MDVKAAYTLKSKFAFAKPMPDIEKYITTQEAAEVLGFHLETIRRLLRDKELEGIKWRREWLVLRTSVDDYRQRLIGRSKFDSKTLVHN